MKKSKTKAVKQRHGRPTEYTAERADEILTRMATGETLRGICRDQHLPDERTVRRWAIENREGFSPRYARAINAARLLGR